LAAFGRTLYSTAIPSASAALAQRLAADNMAIERVWVAMTKDTSLGGVGSDAKAAEKIGGQFDSDVQALTTSLDDDLTPLVNQSFALDRAATALNRQGAALRQRASVLNVLISVLTAAPDRRVRATRPARCSRLGRQVTCLQGKRLDYLIEGRGEISWSPEPDEAKPNDEVLVQAPIGFTDA
jgi:hypothetical protein